MAWCFQQKKRGSNKNHENYHVVLKDHDTQELVFENIAKLKDASRELKNLSVSYDLSREE